jgi:hypothetical protein
LLGWGTGKRLDAQDAELAGVTAALEVARSDIARLRDELATANDALAAATNKLAHLDPDDIGRARALAEDAVAGAANVRGWAEEIAARAARAAGQGEDAAARADLAADSAREALLPTRIAAFTTWLELVLPAPGPMISIVLPTRDRPALLPRAVASAMEQHYDAWELLVVDDGDTDAVPTVLADMEDERIFTIAGPRRGLGAARNAGLEAAGGEIVCYLDDDNVMHPRWLQAVAQVFSTRTDVDVAYGVTLAEHRVPGTLAAAGWWPSFWQLPWSREKLLEQNLTDAGALAHRRGLPEARFDEGLETGEDWDLLLRLTADRPALAVPAVSHAYALDPEDRMSRRPGHGAGLDDIRGRHSRE